MSGPYESFRFSLHLFNCVLSFCAVADRCPGPGRKETALHRRGDRALEISRAFTDPTLKNFDRGTVPEADYYGMLIYDNDQGIPKKALCPNPDIKNVLSEFMIASGVKMYAVSETHKYGHVTFFWNGNRSGYLDESMEKYEEVPSDPATPEQISAAPAMKCVEITDKLVAALGES